MAAKQIALIASDATEICPLLDLPAEIRNSIYDLVFEFDVAKYQANLWEVKAPSHSILCRCRQIYEEAILVYRAACNDFWRGSSWDFDVEYNEAKGITIKSHFANLRAWMLRLRTDDVASITKLDIHLGNDAYWMLDDMLWLNEVINESGYEYLVPRAYMHAFEDVEYQDMRFNTERMSGIHQLALSDEEVEAAKQVVFGRQLTTQDLLGILDEAEWQVRWRTDQLPGPCDELQARKYLYEQAANTPTAKEPSQTSALLDLPAEIRNSIYEMVFEPTEHEAELLAAAPPSKDLLSACRQIYEEAKLVHRAAYRKFWSETDFKISIDVYADIDDELRFAQLWARTLKLNEKDVAIITKLQIRVGSARKFWGRWTLDDMVWVRDCSSADGSATAVYEYLLPLADADVLQRTRVGVYGDGSMAKVEGTAFSDTKLNATKQAVRGRRLAVSEIVAVLDEVEEHVRGE